jgi:hypothetical protein
LVAGENLGPFIADPSIRVDIRYRCNSSAAVDPLTGVIPRSACEYIASNCAVTQPYTEIKCLTAPGSGRDHTWRVELNGAPFVTNALLSTETAVQITRYKSPTVGSIVAPLLRTRGGDVVK